MRKSQSRTRRVAPWKRDRRLGGFIKVCHVIFMQTPLLMQSICWSLTQNKRKVQKNSITWWHRLCYMIAWLMFVQNKGGLCVHFLCCIFIYVCSPRWNIRSYKACNTDGSFSLFAVQAGGIQHWFSFRRENIFNFALLLFA